MTGVGPMSGRFGHRAALAPLRVPAFRRYLLGQLPSASCSWAQVVALSWVVVQLDQRALGPIIAAQFLPSVLLGPWFGALVDRHDRRRMLMLTEAGLALVALGYAAAATAGLLTLPAVFALATAWGVINALDTPARRALVPMLVPGEVAPSAAALAGATLTLSMMLGSALWGALVVTLGVAATFALNAASFVADVAVLASIRVRPSPRTPRAPRQVVEGLRYVLRTPVLRTAMGALAVIATFCFAVQATVPVLVRSTYAGGPGMISMLFTTVTAGCLAGALLLAARGGVGPRTLASSATCIAGGSLAIAIAPVPLLAAAGLAGVGIGWSYLIGATTALLQTARPDLMGRVMALFAAVLLSGQAVGGPLVTLVTAAAGPRAPFVLGAAVAGGVAVVLVRAQRRTSDRAGQTEKLAGDPVGHGM